MKLAQPCHHSLCASPHLWKVAKITGFIIFWHFSCFTFSGLIQVPDQTSLPPPCFILYSQQVAPGAPLLPWEKASLRPPFWDSLPCVTSLPPHSPAAVLEKISLTHASELCYSLWPSFFIPCFSSSASREGKGSIALTCTLDVHPHLPFFF